MKTYSRPVRTWVLLLILAGGLAVFGGVGYVMFYGGARPAVDAYVTNVRATRTNPGEATENEADADRSETNRIIAGSTDLTIKNFATKTSLQKGVGCYWGKLTTSNGTVDVAFYVEKTDGDWRVVRASTTKTCRCANRGGTCSM